MADYQMRAKALELAVASECADGSASAKGVLPTARAYLAFLEGEPDLAEAEAEPAVGEA